MLIPWILAGLALGVINDYVLVRRGLKPALALMTLVMVLSYACWWMGEVNPVHVAVMLAALSLTRYVARPLIRWHHGRSEIGAWR